MQAQVMVGAKNEQEKRKEPKVVVEEMNKKLLKSINDLGNASTFWDSRAF